MNTTDTVANIIRSMLHRPTASNQETLKELGADSLDLSEICVNLEAEFGFSVTLAEEAEFTGAATIESLAAFVEKKRLASSPPA